MDFILGADSKQQNKLTGWLGEGRILRCSAGSPRWREVPHLMPGDSLNLQSAQDTDNGYSTFEQSLLRYISAGLGVSYEQLSRNYSQIELFDGASQRHDSLAFFMGRRKFVAARQACQMFVCWLEEAIARRVVTLPLQSHSASRRRELPGVTPTGLARGAWLLMAEGGSQEAVMLH